MVKKIIFTLYVLIIILLGTATIVEKYQGTDFVATHLYGSWWMCGLWALLTAFGVFYILKQKSKRLSMLTLHFSFVVILLGALLTHLTADNGMIHLRKGETSNRYMFMSDGQIEEKSLPYSIRLDRFEIIKHEGTDAASDYQSTITIISGEDSIHSLVSMNNIYSHNNIRLYQSSYDEDENGSYLSINSDPYGIPVTYTGYALLFIGLIWMLIDPKGQYRRLLKEAHLKKGILSTAIFMCLFLSGNTSVQSANVLPRETATKFCRLNVLYNNRICPLQTYALDFTKKLYGKRSYDGYSAEQVFTGFLFWRESWMKEPIIKIKDGIVCETLGLPKYISCSQLFSLDKGYLLGPFMNEHYRGANDKFHEGVSKVDEKVGLIMELRNLAPLKLFPYTKDGNTTWYGPNDDYPDYIETERKSYMQHIFDYFQDEASGNKLTEMDEAIDKLMKYQYTFGGNSIPSSLQLKSEYLYNAIPFATILFMVCLTMGFLCLFHTIYQLTSKKAKSKGILRHAIGIQAFVMGICFASLTLCMALRWIIRGTIPMSNGYETMLVMAWMIMLVSLLLYKRFRIILTFGFLLSGFFLLVSHISQMDPQITHIMPVLSSPLLTIHVSVIMMAYALLALTFICGIMAIFLRIFRGKKADNLNEQLYSLQLLSRLFLYPSITAMGFGIFIGAIWANVSWGTYWSWDPKETWALITFMVYAISLHTNSIKGLRKPLNYHIFITLAFLTILMTYFGVNYILGGMHSYA